MSTIIGKTSDKTWLQHWAASLGRKMMQSWGWSLRKEIPDIPETRLTEISGLILKQHVSAEAMDHGTAVHEMLEDTLNNQTPKKHGVIPTFH